MSTTPQLSPLEQLGQSVQQQAPPQQTTNPSQPQAQPSNLSPLEQLGQSVQKQQQPDTSGQITNDVGQTVIVPKDGESFADTMARGRALGKQRQQNGTQQQAIDAEMATAPTKAAQTLGAAAGIGVAGPALLALPGEVGELAIKHLAGNVLPGMESAAARETLIQALPKVAEFAKTMGQLGLGAGGLTYLFKSLMGEGKK